MTPPAALLEALDANMAVHAGWIQQRLPGMVVRQDLGFVLVDSGLATDTFNLVCRTRLTEENALARATEGIEWFRMRGRPFSWWVSPADAPSTLGTTLTSLGLEAAEGEVAMTANIQSLVPEPLPDGLAVRRAETPAQLREFAAINAANWSPPDEHVTHFYEAAAPVLIGGDAPLAYHVAYLRGVAVATVEVTTAAGIAGIYNVSTLQHWRNRGFASALLRQVLASARDEGILGAALQAAPAAAGVYRRLGFQPIGSVTEYKPRPAAPT
ncbi:MAG TPA: GNAT family N-acetyltransferase [Gemmatimonadales bacterium]|nr:GNAT family N-acetyltransferase [Gemmatimonadales bacterium]